jgi:predicted amidohydrolase YtcJ
MKRQFIVCVALSMVALVGCTRSQSASKTKTATLVLHNGLIYTADAKHAMAAAIAIADDRIIAVGSNADVDKLIDADTKVIDLRNRFVVPGLIDAHIHAVSGASVASKCTFEDAPLTLDQMKPIVTECLTKETSRGPTDWFQVVSVNPSGLQATAKDIDGLVADRPTFLIGSDGHTGWLNTAGLRRAKITKATPDPSDGKIERDAAGEPTGKLIDAAVSLVLGEIPKATLEQNAQALETVLPLFAAVGVTSIRDPAVEDDTMGVYESVAAAGKLSVRVASSFTATDTKASPDALVKQVKAFSLKHPGTADRLLVDQVKFFADGVIEAPTSTAAMIEPYLDEKGEPTTNRGELYVEPKLFGRQVKALHAAGYSIHVHAIGDRATRVALDAFEFAGPATKSLSSRDQIVHLEVIDPADMKRFKALNVIAGFQADWAFREAYTVEALQPFVGPVRYKNVYAIKSVAESGATIAGGSDWPVSTFNPFQAIQRAVSRRDTRQAQPLGADQAISRQQALDMYTNGAAASMPFAGIGILAVGNKADIAVLNQNLLTVNEYDIEKTVSELTVMNGEIIYQK